MAEADIAARVRALREQRGWTQIDLAVTAGVSTSYVSRLESGDYREPSVFKLQDVAKALGVSLLQLIEDDPEQDEIVHIPPTKRDLIALIARFGEQTLRLLESFGDAMEREQRLVVDPPKPATASRKKGSQPVPGELEQQFP